ncbi:NAD(+) synthase [Anaerolentibacter hominis]|uniref:NAD(+) synthase n=1 Tax=Anaerolentibacter hominis TaxID=3079009 RepID=UPI0031B7FC01
MKQGFLKVSAVTPELRVADCVFNAEKTIEAAKECMKQGVKLAVFPELGLTGYTCADLFLQSALLRGAQTALKQVKEAFRGYDMILVVGFPLLYRGKIYNTAAVLQNGCLLGLVPKSNIPNYAEYYEARQFSPGEEETEWIELDGEKVPFGPNILFSCREMSEFVLGAEICEDLWVPVPPSSRHAMAGATVIVNLSASDETTGKHKYRRELVSNQSGRLICGYIYADAGEGESTTDLVFAGHNMIGENGSILAESHRFENGILTTELDLGRLVSERRRIPSFSSCSLSGYTVVPFSLNIEKTVLTRKFEQTPFVPQAADERDIRCREILAIQSQGLKKRLAHTGCRCAVVGISGGLDSTLALLVTVKAFDSLHIERKHILGITMPGFGTTDRTYQNALDLIRMLGCTLKEIPIGRAVEQHFEDIGHDGNIHDVTYENSQARERTQILMDVANQYNGLVVGTGDLSELALGWATYNGDHMSMYGVNASVPKTLVRYLVSYYARTADSEELRQTLLDVLNTPVSPELLPAKDGEIDQKTEDIVGPYELHDFFLYYVMRFGYEPSKIYRMAVYAFQNVYEADTIYKWLETFYRRFFSQQFKRSCLPDGPKVGSVALSPRGDLRMPSDACASLWLEDLKTVRQINS